MNKCSEGKMQRSLKKELKSTWICFKGREGNQCQHNVILFLLLAVEMLYMGQHWLFILGRSLMGRQHLDVSAHCCYTGSGWGQSLCAHDAGKMVFFYPILKHRPRRLTYVQVQRWQSCMHNESNRSWISSECTICWPISLGRKVLVWAHMLDLKDGELCLSRAKPVETLVDARSDSDVQINHQIWV